MSFGSFGTSSMTGLGSTIQQQQQQQQQQQGSSRDFEVPSPPADGISSLSFSPSSQMLVAGAWDNSVRCWQLARNMNTGPVLGANPLAETKLQAPVLCTDFAPDNSAVFVGGGDKTVMMWQLAQAGVAPVQVAGHDAAVMYCKWITAMNLLVTGSWDKTIKLWDTRAPQPVSTTPLNDCPFAMDVLHPLMVVACGDSNRTIVAYDLRTGRPQEYARKTSPLKYQTRCVACWKDQTGAPGGFAVGSIEGRVGIEYIDELTKPPQVATSKKSFAFKCHRKDINQGNKTQSHVYAVNNISFHPYGTFATAGSDGSFNYWDKDSRQRLKAFDKRDTSTGQQNTISTATFSPDGELYGYALSYDWSAGVERSQPNSCNAILIHHATADEIKPREKDKK